MTGLAFVFPGQGSQRLGMGIDITERWQRVAGEYVGRADAELGFSLSSICASGPAEVLRGTAVAQPAIFTTSMATLAVLHEQGVRPDVVAGHSLGEYAALVCAGALDWRSALHLVRTRGELMASVNGRVPGTMSAILGLDVASVERICTEVRADTGLVVDIANDNEPAQVVVSGAVAAVDRVRAAADAAGAMRTIALAVGAPFHCRLMEVIEHEFAAALTAVDVRDPVLPIVSSVTGRLVTSADQVVDLLRRQVAGRVRWVDTVATLVGLGVDNVVEVGPGRVLSGLCRRCAPTLACHATDTADLLQRALASVSTVAAT